MVFRFLTRKATALRGFGSHATARSARVAPPASFMPGTTPFKSFLVTPEELRPELENPTQSRVVPLCATWFLPNAGRTGEQTFNEQRLPKARFFDLDRYSDRHSELPHMLDDGSGFASTMASLGIRKSDVVVVYDSKEQGIFSAPRVAWTLQHFGHDTVHILNNFRLWVEKGFPTEKGLLSTVECNRYPIPDEVDNVATFEEVKAIVQAGTQDVQILDARGPGRFTGAEAEPRKGLSSGHMPGAINIPFGELLDDSTKAFLPPQQLREKFEKFGVDPSKPIISSCGSGVTACVLDVGLQVAGIGSRETRRIYDGSWTEWAQRAASEDGLIVKSN